MFLEIGTNVIVDVTNRIRDSISVRTDKQVSSKVSVTFRLREALVLSLRVF